MATSATQKLNCLWPLRRGGKGWMRAGMGTRLEAALISLLLTPLGSYPWNPKYGSSLYRLRTQSDPYEVLDAQIMLELQMGVAQWIPDMSLLDVQARMIPSEQKLEVNVLWGVPSSGVEPTYALGPVKTTVLI